MIWVCVSMCVYVCIWECIYMYVYLCVDAHGVQKMGLQTVASHWIKCWALSSYIIWNQILLTSDHLSSLLILWLILKRMKQILWYSNCLLEENPTLAIFCICRMSCKRHFIMDAFLALSFSPKLEVSKTMCLWVRQLLSSNDLHGIPFFWKGNHFSSGLLPVLKTHIWRILCSYYVSFKSHYGIIFSE